MKSLQSSWVVRWSALVLAVVAFSVTSKLAYADVRLEGEWGGDDRPVTLDLNATPRAHAIELLASAAGWSVVMSPSLTDAIDVHVKDQPASKVLALLLPDSTYVARRAGNLVSIQPAVSPGPASSASSAPVSSPPPSVGPRANGEDRTVFGGRLTVEKDEVVHDVAVYGGRLDVYGTVTGDLVVLGGAADVHDGAKVLGSATVIGGRMRVDDGAEVVRDVGVVGGRLDRGDHAKVHSAAAEAEEAVVGSNGAPLSTSTGARAWRAVRRWGDDALSSLSSSALLFVFGAVVIALATERSRALRVEMAARPMRAFALGVVGCVVALGVFVALCVTIIGIPVALVGGVAFVLAAYAGVSAVLTTAGEALLRHRTTSSYVHLALGCSLYFLVGLVPGVGHWALSAVGLAGVGVVVATRGAGFFPGKAGRLPAGPTFGDDAI